MVRYKPNLNHRSCVKSDGNFRIQNLIYNGVTQWRKSDDLYYFPVYKAHLQQTLME